MSDALWSFSNTAARLPSAGVQQLGPPLPSLLAALFIAFFGGSTPLRLETAMRTP